MTLKRGSSVSRSMRTRSMAPGCGALAAADLRAFEGRARWGSSRRPAVAVAEHDLGVGAHIDQQRHLGCEIGTLGKHHARGIRAHMPGDAGQHVDARVAMQLQDR